jgi:hypothetical protein
MREMFSELDHAFVEIARDHPSTFLQKSERGAEVYLGDIVVSTTPRRSKGQVVVSADMSGFSPKMNRPYILEFLIYPASTTCAPEGLNHKKLYDGMRLCINKRGIYGHAPFKSGLAQGFEGTGNTVFHNSSVGFSLTKLKELGFLTK